MQLELGFATAQAEMSADRAHHGNAFTHLIRAAYLGKRLGRDYVITDVVSRIEKLVRSMDGIFESDLKKISHFLDDLTDSSSIPVQRLQQILHESRVL